MTFGGEPDVDHRDERIKAAMAVTRKFIKDHHSITDDDYANLRSYFNDSEISAIMAYMGFISGAVRLGAMFGLEQKDASQHLSI